MAQAQAYIIVVKEVDGDSYALPDGARGLSRVQELMAFRAEEMLDELDSQAVEAGLDPGNFTINLADNGMWLSITNDSPLGANREMVRMELQAISLVDVTDI